MTPDQKAENEAPTPAALRFSETSEAAYDAFFYLSYAEQMAYMHEWARAGDTGRIASYTAYAVTTAGFSRIGWVDGVLVLGRREAAGKEGAVSDER